MRGRGAALMRAGGAFGLVLVLVCGVPWLLVSIVGNPFPTQVPSFDEVRILLTQNGQGFTDFLMSSLAILIWVIWAQLVVALFAEAIATARRTEARQLRLVPGLQGLAARLIATITLAAVLATGPLVPPAVGTLSFDDDSSGAPRSEFVMDLRDVDVAASRVSATATFDEMSRHDVEHLGGGVAPDRPSAVMADHTELWDLAEAAYGDGVSWKLIAEANAGAVDASGVLITTDTESVAAGTELVLPGVPDSSPIDQFWLTTAGRSDEASAVSSATSHHMVETGDSMWAVAEARVTEQLGRPGGDAEVAEYWAELIAANQNVSSGNVDMIYPGETLAVPGIVNHDPGRVASTALDDAREHAASSSAAATPVADGPGELRTSTAHTTTSPTVQPPAVQPPTQSPTIDLPAIEQPSLAERDSEIGSNSDTKFGPATSVPASFRVDTTDGSSTRAPAVGLMAFGTAMLSAGVVSALRRRRDAQRRMRPARTMAHTPSDEAAAFEAALVHSSHLLSESTVGLGWRALPASAVSELRADIPIEVHMRASGELAAVGVSVSEPHDGDKESVLGDPHSDTGSVSASLVVGTDVGTGAAVLINLAPATTLGLSGSSESVRRFVRGVVLDLAVSDRTDDIHVVAVGVGDGLDGLERVHAVANYDDALAHLVRAGLGSGDAGTSLVAVVAVAPVTQESLQKLVEMGAAVIAPGVTSTANISLNGDRVTIEPSGTVAVMAAFDDDDYRAVSELVEVTSATAIDLVDETVQIDDVLDVLSINECVVEPGPIELKILGPVEVAGAAPFSSLKAVDVIAYLAFHRHGVDADQIKSWVWPPFDPPTDKAFANVMSRARTGLGADDTGEPFLSRAGADKTYRLAAAVTTDFDRVRALGKLADQASEKVQTLNLLKQAIELIRGVPFTGGAASSFAWTDNHVRAQVEYTIDELVHRCADLALELDDLDTARWAALKGLALVPGCEQCFRRRFLIARAGNNRSELRRAMADLEAAAMVDLGEPEAVDVISGELLDLYHELDRALVAGVA